MAARPLGPIGAYQIRRQHDASGRAHAGAIPGRTAMHDLVIVTVGDYNHVRAGARFVAQHIGAIMRIQLD